MPSCAALPAPRRSPAPYRVGRGTLGRGGAAQIHGLQELEGSPCNRPVPYALPSPPLLTEPVLDVLFTPHSYAHSFFPRQLSFLISTHPVIAHYSKITLNSRIHFRINRAQAHDWRMDSLICKQAANRLLQSVNLMRLDSGQYFRVDGSHL